jgi:hypothetical protein
MGEESQLPECRSLNRGFDGGWVGNLAGRDETEAFSER